MDEDKLKAFWAPRVRQKDIRRLYESDARGIYDEELLDEVGWALRARCESFIIAVEAVHGRARCPNCGEIIAHNCNPEELLHCPGCGWEVTWQVYFKSFQHKQLSGAQPVLDLFQEYVDRFPAAHSPQEKMLLIDHLIHSFHYYYLDNSPTRTTGVNLIEGSYRNVIAFLDKLTYGEGSTPGTRDTLREWRGKINHTAEAWGDEKLRLSQE